MNRTEPGAETAGRTASSEVPGASGPVVRDARVGDEVPGPFARMRGVVTSVVIRHRPVALGVHEVGSDLPGREESSRQMDARCSRARIGATMQTPSRAAESPGSSTSQQPPMTTWERVLPPGPMGESVSTASRIVASTGSGSAGPGPNISFELFPPRSAASVQSTWQTIEQLTTARPDFFSVTSGCTPQRRTESREFIGRLRAETSTTVVAHLTCVGATGADLRQHVADLLEDGVRDFLALRGDAPADGQWRPAPDAPTRASELVALVREVAAEVLGDALLADDVREDADAVSIAVAAYPSGSARSRGDELAALIEKQQAGADYAITQLFYEPSAYVELVADARSAGVDLPLLPGVMPLTDPSRLERLVTLTGVAVPAWLSDLLAIPDAEERHARGVAATVELIGAVLDAGAPGVHLYTFNRHAPALEVLAGLRARGQAAAEPIPASLAQAAPAPVPAGRASPPVRPAPVRSTPIRPTSAPTIRGHR